MDISSLHLSNYSQIPSVSTFQHRNSLIHKPFSYNSTRMMGFSRFEDFGNPFYDFQIVSKKLKQYSANRSLIVRAMGENNHDDMSSSGGSGDQSIPHGGNGSEGINPAKLDWRTVRANFIARKEVLLVDTDTEPAPRDRVSNESSKLLGPKWAHPIFAPENGCVLIATDKLDGVRSFERTVVFLLQSGNRNPRQGPCGVVINRPLQKQIKHMNPSNHDVATTFADCFLHFGGPLEASMFLLNKGENSQNLGFQEVIPGICFGPKNRLDEAAALVKKGICRPQNFRFFAGYAGWQVNQLREEIESGFWFLAATSPNMIFEGLSGSSSDKLWEEILQLMGGHYAEISRKPKQNS